MTSALKRASLGNKFGGPYEHARPIFKFYGELRSGQYITDPSPAHGQPRERCNYLLGRNEVLIYGVAGRHLAAGR